MQWTNSLYKISNPIEQKIWAFGLVIVFEFWVFVHTTKGLRVQLISAALEHAFRVARTIREIYALENVVFYIAVYGSYKP